MPSMTSASGRLTILIVEDQGTMRTTLRDFLEISLPGCDILEAADGAQALEILAARQPHLILMDVGLPDTNGIELTARIRAALPRTRVIVVSSQSANIYAEQALAAGASAYIRKENLFAELQPQIVQALGITPTGNAPERNPMTIAQDHQEQKTVLIVEDDALMRSILHSFVKNAFPGLTLLRAADGALALELCASHQPQLVLMDVCLPDANGIELTARLKARWPSIKVIIMSGFDDHTHIEQARAAGAIAYVAKDKIHQELLPHIAGALAPALPPDTAGSTDAMEKP